MESDPLRTLQKYNTLVAAHHGSTGKSKLCLRGYGKFLAEGLQYFGQTINERLSSLSIEPIVQFNNEFLVDPPSKVKVPEVGPTLKELVDQIIKQERKKLRKTVGKLDGKEDDLLNMSNLGMSLLTLSDCHNTSETEIFEPETPRMLDDNLLNFDTNYREDKDYKMKTLNVLENKLEAGKFSKQTAPNMMDNTQTTANERKSYKASHESSRGGTVEHKAKSMRPSMQPQGLTKNKSDLGALLQAEKVADNEYFNLARSTAGAVRRELPATATLSKKDSKKTFNDFFVSRNRANTDSTTRKVSEILRFTAEGNEGSMKNNSLHSNKGSMDSRKVSDLNFTNKEEKGKVSDRGLRLAALRSTAQAESTPTGEDSDLLLEKEYRSTVSKKAGRRMDRVSSSPKTEKLSATSKSYTQNSSQTADHLITAKARELMKTKMNHKSIPQKFHAELFKLIDSKGKAFDFSDSQMGDAGIYFISKYVKDIKEIDTLVLDNCKVTDDGLSILLYSMMGIRVEKLYLRDNQISKQGVELIKQFIQMRRGVHLINLKGNPLDKTLMAAYIKEFSHFKAILLV